MTHRPTSFACKERTHASHRRDTTHARPHWSTHTSRWQATWKVESSTTETSIVREDELIQRRGRFAGHNVGQDVVPAAGFLLLFSGGWRRIF